LVPWNFLQAALFVSLYEANLRRIQMIGWAITFLLIALVAAVFGFGGVAAASAGIAKIIFAVFIILFVVSAIVHVIRGRKPPM
jgi:uncharacterized membrane protein YtjA (UPF0391 family)